MAYAFNPFTEALDYFKSVSELSPYFLYKPGLPGGQTAYGGSGENDDLRLYSTSNRGEMGSIYVGEFYKFNESERDFTILPLRTATVGDPSVTSAGFKLAGSGWNSPTSQAKEGSLEVIVNAIGFPGYGVVPFATFVFNSYVGGMKTDELRMTNDANALLMSIDGDGAGFQSGVFKFGTTKDLTSGKLFLIGDNQSAFLTYDEKFSVDYAGLGYFAGGVNIPTGTTYQINGVQISTSNVTEGTNLYFTDERAQDAVGGILTNTNTIDFTYNDGSNTISADVDITYVNGQLDHGLLTGLTDDDHVGYARLAGRSGGQTLIGGTVASNKLILSSTSNATKDAIYIDSLGAATALDLGTESQRLRLYGEAYSTSLGISTKVHGGIFVTGGESGGSPFASSIGFELNGSTFAGIAQTFSGGCHFVGQGLDRASAIGFEFSHLLELTYSDAKIAVFSHNINVTTGARDVEAYVTAVGLFWANTGYWVEDSKKSYYGTGLDGEIYYDGTNLIINPKAEGSGILDVLGTLQTDGYNSADGTAGATENVATLAPDGTTTRTLHFKNGLYTGKTDS